MINNDGSYSFEIDDFLECITFAYNYHMFEGKGARGRTSQGKRGFGGELDEFVPGKLCEVAVTKIIENYSNSSKKLIIDGSSYKGKASLDCVIGNWWNHKLLEADQQISPLSGSIKDQIVIFIGEENINLYGKNYLANHYKLKSKDENIPSDKKLDFDIWVSKKNNLILKVSYKKMGDWEYRLKSFK